MTIVVDASMVVAWLLPDEKSEATDAILLKLDAEPAAAPSILRHEVRNILLQSERRKRISTAKSDELLGRFARIVIDDHGPGDDAAIVVLARTYGLTAYDAAYVALALSIGSPLATLDRAMTFAARACGVSVLGPYASIAP